MARLCEIKKSLEDEAAEEYIPILRSVEIPLLIRAAQEAKPARILEIGTAIGYSALLLAEACPEAEIDTIEKDERRFHKAASVMDEAGLAGRVRCHLGDAAEVISSLKGPYDFLFIDGPKAQYLRHLRLAEPLLSERATVAADNVLFQGLVRSEAPLPRKHRTLVLRLREYIEYVKENYDTKIYEEGDGLAVSVKR